MAETGGFYFRASGCGKHGLRFKAKVYLFRLRPSFPEFGKLWLAAEVLLFVLVGASVDIRYTLKAGPASPGYDLRRPAKSAPLASPSA